MDPMCSPEKPHYGSKKKKKKTLSTKQCACRNLYDNN